MQTVMRSTNFPGKNWKGNYLREMPGVNCLHARHFQLRSHNCHASTHQKLQQYLPIMANMDGIGAEQAGVDEANEANEANDPAPALPQFYAHHFVNPVNHAMKKTKRRNNRTKPPPRLRRDPTEVWTEIDSWADLRRAERWFVCSPDILCSTDALVRHERSSIATKESSQQLFRKLVMTVSNM